MPASEHTPEHAADILWTLLSGRNWEQLGIDCSEPKQMHINKTQRLAKHACWLMSGCERTAVASVYRFANPMRQR